MRHTILLVTLLMLAPAAHGMQSINSKRKIEQNCSLQSALAQQAVQKRNKLKSTGDETATDSDEQSAPKTSEAQKLPATTHSGNTVTNADEQNNTTASDSEQEEQNSYFVDTITNYVPWTLSSAAVAGTAIGIWYFLHNDSSVHNSE